MERVKKLEQLLDNLEAVFCILFGSTMILATILIVIYRYILNQPFTFGEEAARYLTVWFIYVGVAICAQRRGHLGVEAFTMIMPEKMRLVVNKLADLLTIFMFLFLMVCSILMLKQYALTHQESTMMRLPMTLVFSIVPISMLLSAVHYIINFVNDLKALSSDDQDSSEVNV